jgi:predicted AAA+ superfamily ATPase
MVSAVLWMRMKDEFQVHNLFRDSIERFLKEDPHLRRAAAQPFSYTSPLIDAAELREPGVFLITGGRQVGKTTFLKQLMAARLRNRAISPANITFVAGELLRDDDELRREIMSALEEASGDSLIIIDEISYVKDWDKAVKFLADAGYLEETTLILSGSDSAILRSAMKRFAGRRGKAGQVDFVFHPLRFAETVVLKEPALKPLVAACRSVYCSESVPEYTAQLPLLEKCFDDYLRHGGYLTAIADVMKENTIAPATFRTYADWLRGDILKHNKQEKYLLEILRGILKTYASQISWVSLAKELSIEHHKTVSDYLAILEDMNAVIIQEALAEHTLSAAPKKAKKLYFADPFIFHTAEGMLHKVAADSTPGLVETVVASHLRRQFGKTYYIKGAKGEVDVAALQQGGGFLPVEVKWTRQVRAEDVKQVALYKNGLILSRNSEPCVIGKTRCIPLIRYLLGV